MTRIFLTHTPATLDNYFGQRALAQLRQAAEVVLNSADTPLGSAALIKAAQGCQIIVSSRDTAAPAELFAGLPDLAALCRVAVDVRNIDLAAASAHGVLVTHATPGFDTSVSEWVLGVMIDLARGISRAAADFWQGRAPAIVMGRELRGATLGIVGHGFIGQRLARLAQGLGLRVLVHEPQREVHEEGIEQVAFQALLARSDYVVCLAPAVAATANLFAAPAFAAMRPESFFINASRGELVDEAALLDALEQGTIAGAALDVGRAADQMPSLALARHPKLIASPHIGGLTPQASEHQAMDSVRQVQALLQQRWPAGCLNAAQARRASSTFNLEKYHD